MKNWTGLWPQKPVEKIQYGTITIKKLMMQLILRPWEQKKAIEDNGDQMKEMSGKVSDPLNFQMVLYTKDKPRTVNIMEEVE